jgi:hypothetical protein
MSELETIQNLPPDGLRLWVESRLLGTDQLAQLPDERQFEQAYSLVTDVYSHQATSAEWRRTLRTYITQSLDNLAGKVEMHPVLIDQLCYLAPSIANDADISYNQAVASSLRSAISLLSWGDDEFSPKLGAVLALAEMRQVPQDVDFWKSLWDAEHTNLAGSILEGIRHRAGCDAALEWFATARPWQPEVMGLVLQRLLPRLYSEAGPDNLKRCLENTVMDQLETVEHKLLVGELAQEVGIKVTQSRRFPIEQLAPWKLLLRSELKSKVAIIQSEDDCIISGNPLLIGFVEYLWKRYTIDYEFWRKNHLHLGAKDCWLCVLETIQIDVDQRWGRHTAELVQSVRSDASVHRTLLGLNPENRGSVLDSNQFGEARAWIAATQDSFTKSSAPDSSSDRNSHTSSIDAQKLVIPTTRTDARRTPV